MAPQNDPRTPQQNQSQPRPDVAAPAAVPSLVGISPEQLATILGALGTTSATAMREAIRSQRKENPNYPEKSVFNPRGVFDDDGNALAPRTKLTRETFFVGVRLSEELLTDDEIALCNRFTSDKTAREGLWSATLEQHGSKTRLYISVPSKTVDDRMTLSPFTHICRELLDGPDAVNPESMQKQIEELTRQVKALELAKAG